MEKEPQLEGRVELIIDKVIEVLSTPDSINIDYRYTHNLSSGYRIEIKDELHIGSDGFLGYIPSRFLYLKDSHEDNGWPIYSVNIGKLVGKKEITGHNTDDIYHIAAAIDGSKDSIETNLLLQLLEMMNTENKSGKINTVDLGLLDQLFTETLSKGATITNRSSYSKNGSLSVRVSDKVIIGSHEHAYENQLISPEVRIEADIEGEELHIVMERSSDGRLETYTEIADPNERIASYTDETNIQRNENGEIMVITGSIYDERAIANAERAMGHRELDSREIDFIEAALQDTLMIN